jgi:hypothetical protein
MKGRKPTPTALHVLHGNPSSRRLPEAEVLPPGELTEPPAWMTPSQKEGWVYALAHAPPGLLRRVDKGMLAVWVAAEEAHATAAKRLAEGGDTLLMKYPGAPMPFPSFYLSIMNKQALIMMKAADHLGFSPVARARIYARPERGLPSASGAGEQPLTLRDFLAGAPPPPEF